MLELGAVGETKQELANVISNGSESRLVSIWPLIQELINILNVNTEEFVLSTANSVNVDARFEIIPTYMTSAREDLQVVVRQQDFGSGPETARTAINNDVSASSRGLITEVVPSGALQPSSTMVLASANYFTEDWILKFDPSLTTNKTFFVQPQQPLGSYNGSFWTITHVIKLLCNFC
eukprot:TRINITY_DN5843_c0_g1_i1.p3 TRINITY_DN5843_c0_g1~~TRINITY_DN5843_c0_g1_i1.p3  ORF type:complete len:178 (-),score=5.73 TRINITY_DN5843_c0_g1_i1:976-1509(-)